MTITITRGIVLRMKETNLKRDPVKYIRDAVKSRYPKGTSCRICETIELLEFHHYHAVAEMYKLWLKNKSYVQTDVLEHRDEFIASHEDELIHKCVTLCKHDHSRSEEHTSEHSQSFSTKVYTFRLQHDSGGTLKALWSHISCKMYLWGNAT